MQREFPIWFSRSHAEGAARRTPLVDWRVVERFRSDHAGRAVASSHVRAVTYSCTPDAQPLVTSGTHNQDLEVRIAYPRWVSIVPANTALNAEVPPISRSSANDRHDVTFVLSDPGRWMRVAHAISDPKPGVARGSKAAAVQPRSLEFFERIGSADRLIDDGLRSNGLAAMGVSGRTLGVVGGRRCGIRGSHVVVIMSLPPLGLLLRSSSVSAAIASLSGTVAASRSVPCPHAREPVEVLGDGLGDQHLVRTGQDASREFRSSGDDADNATA
jgi:hypothetical protein